MLKTLKKPATKTRTATSNRTTPAQQPATSTKTTITPTNSNRITIDHPKANETVCRQHYSVRITATPCENVEICIDDGVWQPCRNSAGYWWYDMHNINTGNHTIAVRLNNKGITLLAAQKFKA
jgi:hypothetical protein